jgi:NAD-dependent dihydropyrimidine dehydrogenase PreA subunit
MFRDVVSIDREKCNGCGLCVTGCHEGALQVIDGKAVLISELLCDGLGACIGECPENAISVTKQEAAAYNEFAVMENMVQKGKNTVLAHLKHLKEHNESIFLEEGISYLKNHKRELPFQLEELLNELTVERKQEKQERQSFAPIMPGSNNGGCPGSRSHSFISPDPERSAETTDLPSALTHWPVQMHLINPSATHFKNSDLLLAADCVAFSTGNFHSRWLPGKTLSIACPKLDSNKEIYVEKLTRLIEEAKINTITIMIMEVPCCGGLLQIAKMALENASRKVPLKQVQISIQGNVLKESWM